jgi:hypothetical protein
MNNKCHTYNRFNCHTTKSLPLSEVVKTTQAHVFNKAVDCALAVLSGDYMKYSFIGLVAVLALLF